MCSTCFSRGVRLQSLQSWTALTAAQLPLLILGVGGQRDGQTTVTAKLNCTHCSTTSTSDSGGDQTAVTAKLNCTHCSPTSTSDSGGIGLVTGALTTVHFWFWGGVRLQSLHNKSWTALTAAQLPLLILGEGWTAVAAQLDCTHCRSTSLQWFGGGGLLITAAQLPLLMGNGCPSNILCIAQVGH